MHGVEGWHHHAQWSPLSRRFPPLCRSFGAAAGGADVDKGHGHVSIEKLQLVLDFDGQRGLLRKTPGVRRRNRLLYWRDPLAPQPEAAEDDDPAV